MDTIAEKFATVQFDSALRDAALLAHLRYPGEYARLNRGLVLALNGAVTLRPDGSASVQSASDPAVAYEVNGHCDCYDFLRAPDGRCKHRRAKALVKKAQDMLDARPRCYATYIAPDGTAHQGIATETACGWLFVADDGLAPLYAADKALVRLGDCAIADGKREEEEAAGGLVARVCGYGH